MINHLRTLLRNRDGAPTGETYLAEYVDPDYRALVLPAWLESVRGALFGRDNDEAWINFRLRQYLQLLHACDFAAYATALDPRITYLFPRNLEDSRLQLTAAALTPEAEDVELQFSGTMSADSARPRLRYGWTLTVVSGLMVENTELRSGKTVQRTVTVTDLLSSPVPLAEQLSASVAIRHDAPLPAGARWRLDAFVPPPADLAEVPGRLAGSGGAVLDQLFAGPDPYPLFRKLWTDHWLLSHRMAGLLLAVGYRTEEVRRHG